VVIGVHAPEFAFEKNVDNVKKAVSDLKIGYPVAIDNDYAIGELLTINIAGALFHRCGSRIRHHHFGESDYEGSSGRSAAPWEAGKTNLSTGVVAVNASGAEAALT